MLYPRKTGSCLCPRISSVSSFENITKDSSPRGINNKLLKRALQWEEKLGYFVENGKYWKHLAKFDQEKIDVLDELWNRVIEPN